jgi:hypothetical protein
MARRKTIKQKHEAKAPAQTALAKKAAALKATTAAPALSPELAVVNAKHQRKAGLAAAVPFHEHDCEHAHAARAPPRAPRTKTAQAERFAGLPHAVYTISTFCISHDLSEALFFKLKKHGRTPKEMHVNGRVLISFQAAAEWRAMMEAETTAAAATE